jgi:hypothetical protein
MAAIAPLLPVIAVVLVALVGCRQFAGIDDLVPLDATAGGEGGTGGGADAGGSGGSGGVAAPCDGPSCPGVLLVSELVVAPSDSQYIEIRNPSSESIALHDVHLADFNSYYLLAAGEIAVAPNDFLLRFPPGASIAPQSFVTVALGSSASYLAAHHHLPDYDLDGSDGGGRAMVLLGATRAPAALDEAAEMVVMFHWDGDSPRVADVDYIVYGSSAEAMDKSGVVVGGATYADEVPPADQRIALAPSVAGSLSRCTAAESDELATGGNGLIGHDETSEAMSDSWYAHGRPTPRQGSPCPGAFQWGTVIQGDAHLGLLPLVDGDVIVHGYFQGDIVVAGERIPLQGECDALLARLSGEDGSVLWAKSFGGGDGCDFIGDAVVDNFYLYIGGRIGSTTLNLGGPGDEMTREGSLDVFVASFHPLDGSHDWSRNPGGSGHRRFAALALDDNKDLFIAGRFSGSFSFGLTPLSSVGDEDIYVAKLSGLDGDELWARAVGTPYWDRANLVDVTPPGNVVLSGDFTGSEITFGGSRDAIVNAGAIGSSDGYVVELDAATGARLWHAHTAGSGNEYQFMGVVNPVGDVYVSGSTESATLEVGGASRNVTPGEGTMYVAKLASGSGTLRWLFVANGSLGVSQAYGVASDSLSGDALVTGVVTAPALDFGGRSVANDALYNTFIARYRDSDGRLLWATMPVTNDADAGLYGESIAIGPTGEVFATGWLTAPEVNFGEPGDELVNTGAAAAYIVKLAP